MRFFTRYYLQTPDNQQLYRQLLGLRNGPSLKARVEPCLKLKPASGQSRGRVRTKFFRVDHDLADTFHRYFDFVRQRDDKPT